MNWSKYPQRMVKRVVEARHQPRSTHTKDAASFFAYAVIIGGIGILFFVLALAPAFFDERCHTDTECVEAHPGTNGDPE